jgi:hypothetical protein
MSDEEATAACVGERERLRRRLELALNDLVTAASRWGKAMIGTQEKERASVALDKVRGRVSEAVRAHVRAEIATASIARGRE